MTIILHHYSHHLNFKIFWLPHSLYYYSVSNIPRHAILFMSIAKHPGGFWDVHGYTRTPLCAEQQTVPRSELVLWSGRWGSRQCVHLLCS